MQQLIKFHLPRLFQHLRSIQLAPDYFTSKWMMTLFACFLPFENIPPIFDMFLMDGWRSLFKIGITLLKQMEETLLDKDLIDITIYFREQVRTE